MEAGPAGLYQEAEVPGGLSRLRDGYGVRAAET